LLSFGILASFLKFVQLKPRQDPSAISGKNVGHNEKWPEMASLQPGLIALSHEFGQGRADDLGKSVCPKDGDCEKRSGFSFRKRNGLE
jgi:hypothetical protein